MEFEQIVKRLEFLDKQQRELKGNLAALKESLESFEATVDAVSKQIKTISRQMTDIAPAAKRMDQFESILAKQRTDILKLINENEKNRTKAEKDAAKRIQGEIGELNKAISQVKTSFNPSEINKQIRERADENTRAVNDIREIKSSVEEALRANEDVRHSIMANEETRKNDLKRISDIQGELTALRKRIDENREKAVIQADSIRNVENRITELLASELERKQAQSAFLEQQRVAQVDRDKGWKEWQERFSTFQKDAEAM
ncbi:MAG: hypothetical protein L6Q49_03115, partial [Anaerolineales bacterium]|nr:hypothetical protein [Anaerolineales bacterium]